MLTIELQKSRLFNEETSEVITLEPKTIEMEHSLLSLSKWESKWNIPFLGDAQKTTEQTLDYLRCMTITRGVDPLHFTTLPEASIKKISEYINAPMTATTITRRPGGRSRQIITSEVIYYWMVSLQIPFECQKWHLNRLLMLVQVCNENNKTDKKMTRSERAEALDRRRALNKARQHKMNTTG